MVVTEQGLAINVRRILESERWDAGRILGMRAVPWSPDGSDNAFDIQVGMERSAEMVPRSPGECADGKQRSEDLPSQIRLGCSGCLYLELDKDDSNLTAKHVGGELKP